MYPRYQKPIAGRRGIDLKRLLNRNRFPAATGAWPVLLVRPPADLPARQAQRLPAGPRNRHRGNLPLAFQTSVHQADARSASRAMDGALPLFFTPAGADLPPGPAPRASHPEAPWRMTASRREAEPAVTRMKLNGGANTARRGDGAPNAAGVLDRTNQTFGVTQAVHRCRCIEYGRYCRRSEYDRCGARLGLPFLRRNMRYRNLAILLALAAAGNAAELSVGSAAATAGQPATLNVTLASRGAALTGLQFDLEYDATALDVSAAAGPAATDAGKGLQSAMVKPGKQRVLVFGLNQNSISDGIVVVLRVSLKERRGSWRACHPFERFGGD